MPSSARFKSCSRKLEEKQPIRQGLHPDIPAEQAAGSHPPEPEDRRAVMNFRGKSRARSILRQRRVAAIPQGAETSPAAGHETARRSQRYAPGICPLGRTPRETPLRHPVTRTSGPPSGPPWTRVALALRRQAWPPELTAAFPLPESWDPAPFLPPTFPGSCSSPT